MNSEKEKASVLHRVREFFGYNEMEYVAPPGEEPGVSFTNALMLKLDWETNLMKGLAENGIILCGGAITSAFSGMPIKDLDFYVEEPTKLQAAIDFIERYFPKESLYKSINANTWTRSGKGRKKYRVQLITKFMGPPEKIFDDFDFTVVQGCYRFESGNFVLGERFLPDIARKVIVFCGKSHYPICAMYRTLKYQRKGYKLLGTTVIHIALAIARLQITTYRELKEQLFGIDTLFMSRFLEDRQDELPYDHAEFIHTVFNQEMFEEDDYDDED